MLCRKSHKEIPDESAYCMFCGTRQERELGGEKTEAGRNRVIPIRPEGRQYFKYFADQATGDLLISGYVGQRVPANLEKKTPHATRHTYASRARQAGMLPEILQKILGHADYSTTANVYVHTDIAKLIATVED